jgi:hypothetical protein
MVVLYMAPDEEKNKGCRGSSLGGFYQPGHGSTPDGRFGICETKPPISALNHCNLLRFKEQTGPRVDTAVVPIKPDG